MASGFYDRLRAKRKDSDELARCIERVVDQLEEKATTTKRPGMLLGKIQSGKTRAFVGIIAKAFDRDFDIALVLTKGTKTLSAQTVARLSNDFAEFIEDDELMVLDIMKLPGKLRRSELNRKIVIVAKKQAQNLDNLISLIESNAALKKRKMILVDDEADLASVRFVKKAGKDDPEQGKIADKIDELRRMVEGIAVLQVTATPYSLYLQPDGYEAANSGTNFVWEPKKPTFTEVLPIHSGYVGGDDYFASFDSSNPRKYLMVPVGIQELDALRSPDRRRINSANVLETPNTAGLRRGIVTFILAACVRRWQQTSAGEKKRKYAMVIHNDTQKAAHAWQNQVIDWIFDAIVSTAEAAPEKLRPMFNAAFDDIELSVHADKGTMPPRADAFAAFIDALQSDDVVRETVNSDKDVMALLDDKAELKLRTPYNIYVGGNILDRGITIPNLIAFYYGRNPKTMQADTVLQHSRMYGNRDLRDLAVTRFYTSQDVYDRLYTINSFESALREGFENKANGQGVVFVRTDPQHRVRPCAPNKILISNVVAVRPNGLLLPTSFDTKRGKILRDAQAKIDSLIPAEALSKDGFVSIDRQKASDILAAAEDSLEFTDVEFDWTAMRALLDYYSDIATGGDGSVLLLAETGRELHRERSGDKSGLSILGGSPKLRALVQDPKRSKAALILLQQSGTTELGWKGNHKFWWPILAAPGTVEPCIFAGKIAA